MLFEPVDGLGVEVVGGLVEQQHVGLADAWNIDSRLERAMDALQCPPDDQKVATLSGGERRRVALCRLLLQQPDVLLLEGLAALRGLLFLLLEAFGLLFEPA